MSPQAFTDFLKSTFACLIAHTTDGSIHYVCMDWRHIGEMMAAGNAVYSELKNLVVWAKSNAGMGSFYRSQHELIFVWKSGTAPASAPCAPAGVSNSPGTRQSNRPLWWQAR
jgi:hypothetical protein